MFAWWTDCLVAVVGDIEGGAIAVARLVGRVKVGTHEPGYVFFGAQYAADEYLVKRYVSYVEAVEKIAPYDLQQVGSPGHEIGYAAAHAVVNLVVWVAAHEYKLAFAVFGLGAVLDGFDSMAACADYLYVLCIGEGL